MSTKKLKERLIERIKETNDPIVIDNLYKLLELELDLLNENIYTLTQEEEIAMREAEEDIRSGKLLSENEANERTQKWIS